MAQVCFSVREEVGLHNTDLLTAALGSLPGVTAVRIDKAASRIDVDFDSSRLSGRDIAAKIDILGYPIHQI